ncbi:MAG: [Fe-Fe] hydrogenase large subunit C-terminal domain-containing protein [Clostridiales bacterium]
MRDNKDGVIYTLSAKCRDCYRCLRECPVNAIAIKDGQAYIESDRCIICGNCINECPQGAKVYINSIEMVKGLLESDDKVIASVAPSYAAVYNKKEADRLSSILRKLGFWKVINTSESANIVGRESIKYIDENKTENICSACPVVVNYIQKYAPEHVKKIIPIASPMIVHGRLLRNTYGNNIKVVFIGPCIAKKDEAKKTENIGVIDAVLTFKELDEWIKNEKLDISLFEENAFDMKFYSNEADIFPIPGGLLKSGGRTTETTNKRILHTSGYKRNIELLDLSSINFDVVELLFCEEGCINGPGINKKYNLFDRKINLLNYYEKKSVNVKLLETDFNDIYINKYKTNRNFSNDVDESKVLEILSLTGKEDIAHRLNCGACGYKSCEEKAKAVVLGMAEAQMCIPYMRRLAEQKADVIIETIPNELVLLDNKLKIISMNSSFRESFLCSKEMLGKNISYLFDSDGYEKLVSFDVDSFKSIVKFNNIEYYQYVYSLREQKQFVGIYTKINKDRFDEVKMHQLKDNLVGKVLELRNQQINMAHDVAMLLGENSARVEEILWRLMNVYEEDK